MADTFERIDAQLRSWIERQHVFFVATAPRADDGLLNCSPKGLDSLRVLDDRTIAYLDLTGSGVETIAHLRENGRITLMFCEFAGAPKTVRLHGKGTVLTPATAEFDGIKARFTEHPGARAIINPDKLGQQLAGYHASFMDALAASAIIAEPEPEPQVVTVRITAPPGVIVKVEQTVLD